MLLSVIAVMKYEVRVAPNLARMIWQSIQLPKIRSSKEDGPRGMIGERSRIRIYRASRRVKLVRFLMGALLFFDNPSLPRLAQIV